MVNGWANVEDATKSALGAQGEFLSQNERQMKSYASAIDAVGSRLGNAYLRGVGNSNEIISGLKDITAFLDNMAKSFATFGDEDANLGERLKAQFRIVAPVGYGLLEDVLPGNGPSPRRQRQMQEDANVVRNRYPTGWSRIANDMSDPTKVGSTAGRIVYVFLKMSPQLIFPSSAMPVSLLAL